MNNPKRVAARAVAITTGAAIVAGISTGAYLDAGGWPAVAVVWGMAAVLLGLARAFVWAVDNWNA
jgi:fatty acid desaturase